MPEITEELQPTGIINCAAYSARQRVADLPVCDIKQVFQHGAGFRRSGWL